MAHRRVLALVLWALALAAPVRAQPAPESPIATPQPGHAERLPSAESLFDLALEAVGGREAREKVRSRTLRGSYRQSDDTFEADVFLFEQRPNLRRIEIILYNGELLVDVVGKDACWIDNNGDRRRYDDARAAALRLDATFDVLTDWKQFYASAETIAVETLDDRPVRVVRLTAPSGATRDLLFDAETHLLVAERTRVAIDDARSFPRLIKYAHFKPFAAITYPTSVEIIMGEGERARTIWYTWTRIEHDKPVRAGTYDTPRDLAAPPP